MATSLQQQLLEFEHDEPAWGLALATAAVGKLASLVPRWNSTYFSAPLSPTNYPMEGCGYTVDRRAQDQATSC